MNVLGAELPMNWWQFEALLLNSAGQLIFAEIFQRAQVLPVIPVYVIRSVRCGLSSRD